MSTKSQSKLCADYSAHLSKEIAKGRSAPLVCEPVKVPRADPSIISGNCVAGLNRPAPFCDLDCKTSFEITDGEMPERVISAREAYFAPDLLAALQAISELAMADDSSAKPWHALGAIREKADAAIAAAMEGSL